MSAGMFDRRDAWRWGALAVLLVLAMATAAVAQSGGGYEVVWSTADGGGGTSAGGNLTVSGSIGQADAGTMSGGVYTLSGGFWPGSAGYRVYLPLVMKRIKTG